MRAARCPAGRQSTEVPPGHAFLGHDPASRREAQKLLQRSTRQLSPAGLEGAAEPTTALIFKHFDKRAR